MRTEYRDYLLGNRHTGLIEQAENRPDLQKLLCAFRENTTRTLVIHPLDPTTSFLSAIYKGKGWNVLTDVSLDNDAVAEVITIHDRLVLLGHGTEHGLFGGRGFVINAGLAPLLRERETICIWCNADEFVNEHGLKGFYSGMFISETSEANMYGITTTDESAIKFSNELFASALGKYVDADNILEKVKREYSRVGDPVITFNKNRLHCNLEAVD